MYDEIFATEQGMTFCVSRSGTLSSSPSALFVASDGATLRVYQAVIDARKLLSGVQVKPPVSIHRLTH